MANKNGEERLTKKEIIQRFRRREILRAAREVFAESGFEDTTMDKIAERAGISKGTLYLYFKSKGDLLIQAIAEIINTVYEMAERVLKADVSPLEKVKLWISETMNYFEQNRPFFRVLQNISGKVHIESMEGEIKKLMRRPIEVYALVGKILEDGVKEGKLVDVPPTRLGTVLTKIIEGVLICRMNDKEVRPISEDIELIYQAFINGVGRKEME
ncbi:MAG: TetR/AcrR family transcriptional regulator [Acidobacteria bacterium]|nr:TetR/AcrR family transcriptional regulator [Acidobacteriota bacterium]